MLGKAVRRGLKTPLMVGDMPMGSYEASNELAIQNAQRLVKETGCQVVKLEAGGTSVERARAIVRSGIPVMGHVGLTPADRDRAGRLQDPGQDRAERDQALRGRPRPAVGRLLRDRLRGGPGGDHRGDRREARDADDRDRRRPGDRRPGPRLPRPARDHHRPHGRNSSSATPTSTTRWSTASSRYADEVRSRHFPEARPRLRRRAGRAGRVPALPRPGEPHVAEGAGTGSRSPSPTRTGRPRLAFVRAMPIYEFECEECGSRFEELVAGRGGRGRLPELRVDPRAAAALGGLAARAPAARRRGALGRIAAARARSRASGAASRRQEQTCEG